MTAYEFWMPLVLLGGCSLGVLWMRHEGKVLERRLEEARAEERPTK